MLRQIEWRVQIGPIAMNGVLPVTSLFFVVFQEKINQTVYSLYLACNSVLALFSLFLYCYLLFIIIVFSNKNCWYLLLHYVLR